MCWQAATDLTSVHMQMSSCTCACLWYFRSLKVPSDQTRRKATLPSIYSISFAPSSVVLPCIDQQDFEVRGRISEESMFNQRRPEMSGRCQKQRMWEKDKCTEYRGFRLFCTIFRKKCRLPFSSWGSKCLHYMSTAAQGSGNASYMLWSRICPSASLPEADLIWLEGTVMEI